MLIISFTGLVVFCAVVLLLVELPAWWRTPAPGYRPRTPRPGERRPSLGRRLWRAASGRRPA